MNERASSNVLHPRWVYGLLVAGIMVRLLALNQPLVDAHLFRQTQTALLTKGMLAAPGWPLGAVATWRGDLPAYLIQEFPLYNYLVMPVYRLTGNLDVSGKLVSVLLWIAGYLVLQRIWRRCLTAAQSLWANFLFVFAPLSVFFGQAFMPEMLVQLIAFGFVLALLRYNEKPVPRRFVLAVAIGLLGMVVKSPEILHLYLIAGILLIRNEGIRAARIPAYWIAFIVSAVVVKSWGHLMDVNNAKYFPEWASTSYLIHFIGVPWNHINPAGYFKIALYLTALVVTPIGLPFVIVGVWRVFSARPWRFVAWWVVSVVFFFVFWSGPVARGQSYYNLPALAPCAALFGIGVDWLLNRYIQSVRLRRAAEVFFTLTLSAACVGGIVYLFRPDRVVVASTRWIREHTQPKDLILLKANHRFDAIHYPALTPFPYYAQRRFWVYGPGLSPDEKERALATAKYALITLPPRELPWTDRWRRRLRPESFEPEDILAVLKQSGFRPVYTNDQFQVFVR
jgi:4-amino-4-deoxy-L-arabinose transferase-like glycosyltransferase